LHFRTAAAPLIEKARLVERGAGFGLPSWRQNILALGFVLDDDLKRRVMLKATGF
jgi:hypothetical protein